MAGLMNIQQGEKKHVYILVDVFTHRLDAASAFCFEITVATPGGQRLELHPGLSSSRDTKWKNYMIVTPLMV